MSCQSQRARSLARFACPQARGGIYRVLYENRCKEPLTMQEIRAHLAGVPHEQLQRRRRELNSYFVIDKMSKGRETAFRLVERKAHLPRRRIGCRRGTVPPCSRPGSAQCATAQRWRTESSFRWTIRFPVTGEGTDDLENLQPLCEECNQKEEGSVRHLR